MKCLFGKDAVNLPADGKVKAVLSSTSNPSDYADYTTYNPSTASTGASPAPPAPSEEEIKREKGKNTKVAKASRHTGLGIEHTTEINGRIEMLLGSLKGAAEKLKQEVILTYQKTQEEIWGYKGVEETYDFIQSSFLYKGPAKDLYPARYAAILDDIGSKGGEIRIASDLKPWYGGYEPSTDGTAGVLKLDDRVDLSTLEHEYRHFLDDAAHQFPGRYYLLFDDDGRIIRLQMERNAYDVEKQIVTNDNSLSAEDKQTILEIIEIMFKHEESKITGQAPQF